jgi:hypothetical protein
MSITRELTSLSALNGMGLQTSFSLKGEKKGGGGGVDCGLLRVKA